MSTKGNMSAFCNSWDSSEPVAWLILCCNSQSRHNLCTKLKVILNPHSYIPQKPPCQVIASEIGLETRWSNISSPLYTKVRADVKLIPNLLQFKATFNLLFAITLHKTILIV